MKMKVSDETMELLLGCICKLTEQVAITSDLVRRNSEEIGELRKELKEITFLVGNASDWDESREYQI